MACPDSAPPIEPFSLQMLGGEGMLLSSDSGILDSGMQLLPDSGMQLNSALPPGNCTQQQSALTGYYYFGNDLVAEYAGSGYTGGVLSANYIYANGERVVHGRPSVVGRAGTSFVF